MRVELVNRDHRSRPHGPRPSTVLLHAIQDVYLCKEVTVG